MLQTRFRPPAYPCNDSAKLSRGLCMHRPGTSCHACLLAWLPGDRQAAAKVWHIMHRIPGNISETQKEWGHLKQTVSRGTELKLPEVRDALMAV